MNSRSFLTLLSALPGLAFLRPKAEPESDWSKHGPPCSMDAFVDFMQSTGESGPICPAVEPTQAWFCLDPECACHRFKCAFTDRASHDFYFKPIPWTVFHETYPLSPLAAVDMKNERSVVPDTKVYGQPTFKGIVLEYEEDIGSPTWYASKLAEIRKREDLIR